MAILVLAALLGGIYALYRVSLRDTRVDDAVHMIDEIKQLDFAAIDPSVSNPWGKAVQVSRAEKGIHIEFEGVPSAACLQLGVQYTTTSPDFISMKIGENSFGEGFQEINADTLNAACTASETLKMAWNFR